MLVRYQRKCPWCSEVCEGYEGNNLFCKCFAKFYWEDKVWLNRNTGEEVWEGKDINALPKENRGHGMNRYIDEKDVYRLVAPSGLGRVHCSQIDELPRADVVEVIRCKDCRYSYVNQKGYLGCNILESSLDWVEPTGYCSHGERREK